MGCERVGCCELRIRETPLGRSIFRLCPGESRGKLVANSALDRGIPGDREAVPATVEVASGIYFLRAQSGDHLERLKLAVLR